jgi:hypothetical protein
MKKVERYSLLMLQAVLAQPLCAQLGERRQVLENEFGYPFGREASIQVAARKVDLANYAVHDGSFSACYVNGLCVVLRFNGDGDLADEKLKEHLKRISPRDQPWKLSSRQSREVRDDKSTGTEDTEYYSSPGAPNRSAIVSRSTLLLTRKSVVVKSWTIFFFDGSDKEFMEALRRRI